MESGYKKVRIGKSKSRRSSSSKKRGRSRSRVSHVAGRVAAPTGPSGDMRIKTFTNNISDAGTSGGPNTAWFINAPVEANSIVYLNEVPVGNSQFTRTGKGFMMHAISIRAIIDYAGAVDFHDVVALTLVYQRGKHGAGLLPDNVLDSTVYGQTNLSFTSEFKILKRWVFRLASDAQFEQKSRIYYLDDFVKLRGKETKFFADDTVGDVTKMEKGCLFFHLSSYVGIPTDVDTHAYLRGSARLYFYN